MPCIFSENQEKVILERKVLVAKRKVKNPNDKRIANRPADSLVFYLPITKDLATKLRLSEGDYVIAEIGKAPDFEKASSPSDQAGVASS
jgi:hypothetical protein